MKDHTALIEDVRLAAGKARPFPLDRVEVLRLCDAAAQQQKTIVTLESEVERLRSGGAGLIAVERRRQYTEEPWSEMHDDLHDGEELLAAAFCYLGDLINGPHAESSSLWPWERAAWKPTPNDRVRQMVKAGALIAAEIDRLQRDEALSQQDPTS